MTVNLKFKMKTYFFVCGGGGYNPPYCIYINKVFKIVIQFKKLDKILREIRTKILVEKNKFVRFWTALYILINSYASYTAF